MTWPQEGKSEVGSSSLGAVSLLHMHVRMRHLFEVALGTYNGRPETSRKGGER